MSPVAAERASADSAPGAEDEADDVELVPAALDVDAEGVLAVLECDVPDEPQPATTARTSVAAAPRRIWEGDMVVRMRRASGDLLNGGGDLQPFRKSSGSPIPPGDT
jgi:hypothetical protein